MIIDFRMRPPARGFLNIGVYDDGPAPQSSPNAFP